jgi:opacity protein-like surface antigen
MVPVSRILWVVLPLSLWSLGSALADEAAKPDALGLHWQSGQRLWYSTGEQTFEIDNNFGIARLNWDNLTGVSSETFFRADHTSGAFIKGQSGAGSLFGGGLRLDNYDAAGLLDSSTQSNQRDGNLTYWAADLGFDFFKGKTWRAGGFVGTGQWSEQVRSFGCEQTAGNPFVCVPSFPDTVGGIADRYNWHFWRLGVAGDVKLNAATTLSVDAAYVFDAALSGGERHPFADGESPYTSTDSGRGVQLEALLNYQVDDRLSLGFGGRYWHIGDGKALMYPEPFHGRLLPATLDSTRYGVFVQASYKLGGVGHASNQAHDWSGPYVGGRAGHGWRKDTVAFDGDDLGFGTNNIDFGGLPASLDGSLKGVVGGVTAGYNWQNGAWLTGIEADILATEMTGADSYSLPFYLNTTIEKHVSAIGTLRARLGYLPWNSLLVYGTAGLAIGDTSLKLSLADLSGCPGVIACGSTTTSGLATGWTIGGGYEYAINDHVTWASDYQYIDLGSRSAAVTGQLVDPADFLRGTTEFRVNVLRSGLNYKF